MSLTLPLPPLLFPTDASLPHLPPPLPSSLYRSLAPPPSPALGGSHPPRRRPAADPRRLPLRTGAGNRGEQRRDGGMMRRGGGR
jgi:hypothetical protein